MPTSLLHASGHTHADPRTSGGSGGIAACTPDEALNPVPCAFFSTICICMEGVHDSSCIRVHRRRASRHAGGAKRCLCTSLTVRCTQACTLKRTLSRQARCPDALYLMPYAYAFCIASLAACIGGVHPGIPDAKRCLCTSPMTLRCTQACTLKHALSRQVLCLMHSTRHMHMHCIYAYVLHILGGGKWRACGCFGRASRY